MALNTISVLMMVPLVWTPLEVQNHLSNWLPDIFTEIVRRHFKLSQSQGEIIFPTHCPQWPILPIGSGQNPWSYLWHLCPYISHPGHQQVLFVPSKHIPQSNHFFNCLSLLPACSEPPSSHLHCYNNLLSGPTASALFPSILYSSHSSQRDPDKMYIRAWPSSAQNPLVVRQLRVKITTVAIEA